MCLAVPGKVVKRDDDLKATVDMMGIERPVSLRLVPTAQVGDYILVHAGFGIQMVDEQEAQETLELVNAMSELAEAGQLATNPAVAYYWRPSSRLAPVSISRHSAIPSWLASSSSAFMSLSATAPTTLWKSAARIP